MIVKNISELPQLLMWLQNSPTELFAYDIETTGLEPRRDHVVGIGLSNGIGSAYVMLKAWSVADERLETLIDPSELSLLFSVLSQKKLLAHNAAFDLAFTKLSLGYDLINALHADTMLLKHTINEEGKFGLKDAAVELFGPEAVGAQTDMLASIRANGGTAKEYFKADPTLLAVYCMQDCDLTHKLYRIYRPRLMAEKTEDFFFAEVMQLYKTVTIPMEMHGVALDMPLLRQAKAEIDADIAALEYSVQQAIQPHLGLFTEWFLNKDYPPSRKGVFAQAYATLAALPLPKTATGAPSLATKGLEALPDSHAKAVLLQREHYTADEVLSVQQFMYQPADGSPYMFNLNSKHHLKKLFFATLGEKAVSYTDLGSPQVDDEFLQLMAQKHPWVQDLQAYNKLVKIRGTYVERFLDEQIGGRFYPSFMQHRTVSGRYGSDLQQLSRKIKDGHPLVVRHNNRIRDFIIAGPGRKLVGADYNSLEPRVFAHCSRDVGLKKIFQDNLDFYSEIAIRTEGIEGVSSLKSAPNYLGTVMPERRQSAKPYALGIPYGMGAFKLAFELQLVSEYDFLLYKEAMKATQENGPISPEQTEAMNKVKAALSEAQEKVDAYLYAFPELHTWMKESQQQAQKFGYVRVESGRVRHLSRAKAIYEQHGLNVLDTRWIRAQAADSVQVFDQLMEERRTLRNQRNNAINIQVQGLAASIVNRACIALTAAFAAQNLDATIVMQIHDEIVSDCSEADASQVAELTQQIMGSVYPLSVPLSAIPVVGDVYGALK